jgi:hypothetical protein
MTSFLGVLVLLVIAFATDAVPAFAFKPFYDLFTGHKLFYTHQYTLCQRKMECKFSTKRGTRSPLRSAGALSALCRLR